MSGTLQGKSRKDWRACCGRDKKKEAATYKMPLLPGFKLPLKKLLAVADRWSEAEETP